MKPANPRPVVTICAVCLLLAGAVWFIYGQTLRYGFVNFDDQDYVYENPFVMRGLSAAGIRWALTHVHACNWHPLTWLSHMADCEAYGLNGGGHHLTNLLLHGASSVLVFLTVERMTGRVWRGAAVAALFAVHPLHVESVAWIAERKDVLSGFFFMLTLMAYAMHALAEKQRPLWYALALVCCALGLLSKSMLVTLPAILLVLDYWPLKRLDRESALRRLVEKLPFAFMAAGSVVITVSAQGRAMSGYPLGVRVANALASLAVYVGQFIWPAHLAVFYPLQPAALSPVAVALCATVLLGITAGAIAAVHFRRAAWFAAGWAWYLIMVAPVIGIIQVGSQAHADRYAYLPHIGLYVIAVWSIAEAVMWLPVRLQKVLPACVWVPVLAAYACAARAQAHYWRDSVTLWTHALEVSPESPLALSDLAQAQAAGGDPAGAELNFKKAVAVGPDDWVAQGDYGVFLLHASRQAEALPHLLDAIAINPSNAGVQNALGVLLVQAGRLGDAIPHFQQAVASQPDFSGALENLGYACSQRGDQPLAVSSYQQALQVNPYSGRAMMGLAEALAKSGRYPEAVESFRRYLAVAPDDVPARFELGLALRYAGRTDEAIAQFREVLIRRDHYALAHLVLAELLRDRGDKDEAISEYQTVIKLEPGNSNARGELEKLRAADRK